jgi:4-coumarate--CoA ligase
VIFVDVTTGKRHRYREVRDASEKFGKALKHNWDWRKGDVMAIFTPNSADIGAVIFGTLRAGGIVCPINNLSTAEELASYLKSSGARGMTTHISCLEVARTAARKVGLPLDRIVLVGEPDSRSGALHFASFRSAAADGERPAINPKEDLAFLVYSSGTTGLPKGVMLSHENMIANILQNSAVEGKHTKWGSDRSIGFLPMYHIYGRFKAHGFLRPKLT